MFAFPLCYVQKKINSCEMKCNTLDTVAMSEKCTFIAFNECISPLGRVPRLWNKLDWRGGGQNTTVCFPPGLLSPLCGPVSPCFLLGFSDQSLFTYFCFILFLRERHTEYKLGRGRERGRHRIQRRLQALSCQHRT